MISNNNIFTSDSLNIFTDASIKTLSNGERIGCAGAILVFGELKDNNIVEKYDIIRNTTNNNSEIKAVRLGVQEAIRNSGPNIKVRLFSDSQISIYGIRNRIFNWKFNNGVYSGSEGTPIKNQDIFMEIIYDILFYDLHIEFYHQKGHVQYTYKSLLNAEHVFSVSNNIRDNIDIGFIKQISKFNNMVDEGSRKYMENINIYENNYIEPLHFDSVEIDKRKYLELIKFFRKEY